MSWKMIVAGGHVTAIEKQTATAIYLQKNVMKAKAFLNEEDVKSVCSLKNMDVLSFKEPFYQENFYDILWAGNFIHFLAPKQLESFIILLYNIIKPNGYVFVETIQSAISNSRIFSFYQDHLNQGGTSPGFIVINKTIHQEVSEWRDKRPSKLAHISYEEIKSISIAEEDEDLTKYNRFFRY